MTRRRLLLALVAVVLAFLAVPPTARVVAPPPDVRVVAHPPSAGAPPAAEERPADVEWHRELQALVAEAHCVCPAGDLAMLCEGPTCILFGGPPSKLDHIEAFVRRPLLPTEGLLASLGVSLDLLPCARVRHQLSETKQRLGQPIGKCFVFIAPHGPPADSDEADEAVKQLCARFE